MIDFKPFIPADREQYEQILFDREERGCEYGFTNLYMWGRQNVAYLHDHVLYFSQFNRKSVYLFPIGQGDKKVAIQAIMEDAKERGIPCRLTGLTEKDWEALEQLFPGQFRCHFDRDSFDYVYDIQDLCELKGRKYQKKRNHLNRFRAERPDHKLIPITLENLPVVEALAKEWYARRLADNPHGDYQMEQAALKKALRDFDALGLEGVLLEDQGQFMAFAIGSPLRETTFDIHFEKALEANDGTYAAINQGFAAYLQDKYPQLQWINREDDMGLEGLRKAKLSYNPHHMVEKRWVCLLEDGYDY